MTRRQLPPQIKKIIVADRKTGKPVVRYRVTVDTGVNQQTGRRQQAPSLTTVSGMPGNLPCRACVVERLRDAAGLTLTSKPERWPSRTTAYQPEGTR